MDAFLAIVLAWPTALFTTLLVVVFAYWMLVIVGALDVDMIGLGEGAEGVTEAALEGTAEGAGDALSQVHEGLSLAGLLSFLGLRKAPFTVVMSLLVLASWSFCFLGMRHLAPALSAVLPGWAVGAGMVTGALGLAIPCARLLSMPIGALFEVQHAETHRDLVGKICRVDTGTVDETFGMGTVQDDGRWVKVHIRAPAGRLTRGDEALLVDYDPEQAAFRVEGLSRKDTPVETPAQSNPPAKRDPA